MTQLASASDGSSRAFGTTPDAERKAPANGPKFKGCFAWAATIKRKVTGEAVGPKLLLVGTSQLAVMLSSGCGLCAGLGAFAKQQVHPTLKLILADLHERVKQGQSFSQALARHPETFSDLFVTMV